MTIRDLLPLSLLGSAVFAVTLLLPTASADASHPSARSGSSASVGFHFRSGRSSISHRHGIHQRHSLRHRHGLHHRHQSFRHRHSLRHRHHFSPRHRHHHFKHRHRPRHRTGLHLHFGHSVHRPRRTLLHRHYYYHGIVPPSSSIYVPPRRSVYSSPSADASPRREFRYDYRDAAPTPAPAERTFDYPYLDEADRPDAGPDPVRDAGGWTLLRTGNADDARNVFARQLERDPDAPRAQLGYALAIAEADDDFANAARAARQSVILAPVTLTQIEVDHPLERRLDGLLDRLDAADPDEIPAADAPFFRAVLLTMLGRYDAAAEAVDTSLAVDDAPSARALKGFLDTLQ